MQLDETAIGSIPRTAQQVFKHFRRKKSIASNLTRTISNTSNSNFLAFVNTNRNRKVFKFVTRLNCFVRVPLNAESFTFCFTKSCEFLEKGVIKTTNWWHPSVVNALGEFVHMEKLCRRYVIQYFHLNGLSPINIKVELDSTLKESSLSFTTIKYRTVDFKRSRTICQDENRNARPNEVTTSEMAKRINRMVLYDSRPKVHELANMVGIPESGVHHILTENLGVRKSCERWLLCLLKMEQKQRREDVANECLESCITIKQSSWMKHNFFFVI